MNIANKPDITDQRGTMLALPENARRMLTLEQLLMLNQLESFGWRIAFIRRPLFQKVVVVLKSYEGKEFGVLDTEGNFNTHPDIQLREIAIVQLGDPDPDEDPATIAPSPHHA